MPKSVKRKIKGDLLVISKIPKSQKKKLQPTTMKKHRGKKIGFKKKRNN